MAKGIPTKKKVLIVEDDRELADAIKDRLKKEGFESLVSPNGETLPEKCAKYRPQLIVLDLNLPKRSGFLALGDLKGDVETEGIPVLVLTVRTETSAWERCYGQGANAYLVKPFEMEEFIRRVKMLTR